MGEILKIRKFDDEVNFEIYLLDFLSPSTKVPLVTAISLPFSMKQNRFKILIIKKE